MGKAKSAIIEDMEHCYVCGRPSEHTHHIFYGTANRQISDRYGYVVALCQEHHTGTQGVHFNKPFNMHLKRMAQEHFERVHGDRTKFIEIFGKSYM